MKVVITAAAKRDLSGIADHIKPHNPGRAASFVEELLDHCRTLAEMPLRLPLVPRFEHVRRRVHADYLIFYRVRTDFVEVINVLHGARDYEVLLFPNR